MGKIEDRFEVSRKELLDLSFRNPLLNYKLRAISGLEFSDLNCSDIYDYLVNQGKHVYFTNIPTTNPSKLVSLIDEKELKKKLLKTYRQAKLYLEEKGANILFLALGFLKWKDNSDDIFYRSPLILIPVDIYKQENSDKFYIDYSGEEIRLNISLITKLKNDFNINIDYEEDDEIKEVDKYFRFVLEAIKNQDQWEVELTKGAFDFFSYAKFLMYKDLDLSIWLNNDKNLDNKILEKLFITDFDDKLTENIDVEKDLDPLNIHNVVDADSSQGKVIFDINKGKNMVIQGPPGTGKSQTITNIIASSILLGKSILFVSEKKAALDVVKRRLENVGLGDLVLELHSQKTNKKDVLKSIEKTLNLGDVNIEDDAQLNKKYEDSKDDIDKYLLLLRKEVNKSSLSLIDIYGEALEVKEKIEASNARLPRIAFENIANWTNEEFNKRYEVVSEFVSLVNSIGKIEKHPLYGVTLTSLLPYEQVALKEKVSDLEESLNNLVQVINDISNVFETKSINTIFDAGRLVNSIYFVKKYQYLSKINPADPYYLTKGKELDEYVKNAIDLQKQAGKYSTSIYLHQDEIKNLADKYFSLSFFERKKDIELNKELSSYFTNKKINKGKIKSLLEHLNIYKKLHEIEPFFKYLFKDLFTGLFSTNWSSIFPLISDAKKFLTEIMSYSVVSQVRLVIQDLDKIEQLDELLKKYFERKKNFEERLEAFFASSKFDSTLKFPYNFWYLDYTFNDLRKTILSWKFNLDSIVDVVRYNSLVEDFKKLKLDPLFNYYLNSGKQEYLIDILSFEYYDSLINYAYAHNQDLAQFKEYKMERLIEIFKELDLKMEVENIKTILKYHYDHMPKLNDQTKAMAIIRRELQKKRNQMPIRKLFLKSGFTIQKIKPVFMMSPISVANFLPPKEVTFDLVVFDEASQVRPVEAFGALLRAKQVVVVGDSKQLPPTNFFDNLTNKFDDLNDEDYDVSNMESILSLLLAKNIPQRTLSWHYRSKNQSLISLSNNEFYNSKLKVFPSVNDKDPNQGLIFKYLPDSIYDRGGSRTNKIEANYVIKEVLNHAKNYPEQSLGVASFSLAQQEELYREFDRQMKLVTDPAIKEFFNKHQDEPFFIKNLESVQGDERDAIFISIGYGYDQEHNITMDFGPLNKDGGERRLNVLITRAKIKCLVFSNINSHDINLSKTSAKGVVALKRFLDYAQNRTLYKSNNLKNYKEDKFSEYLANKLSEYGYQIDQNIGANVGIDLAIFDPETNSYTVGIECDSSIDLSDSTTDRERIRRNVLKSLGWRIYHVYAPVFYRNPRNEFNKLIDYIIETKKDKEENNVNKINVSIIRKENKLEEKKQNIVTYSSFVGPKRPLRMLTDSILLKNQINRILKVEAPMPLVLLNKILASLTNIPRLNSEYEKNVKEVVKNLEEYEIHDDGFIYPKFSEYKLVRNRENLDKAYRRIEFIPDIEIINAIYAALENGEATDLNDINKVVLFYLGFTANKKLEDRINGLLSKLLEEKKLYLDEGFLYIQD